MSKTYNLDSNFPTFYGEENRTIRDYLEKGEAKVFVETQLYPRKNHYVVRKNASDGMTGFGVVVNGTQARKYVNKSTGHLKDF